MLLSIYALIFDVTKVARFVLRLNKARDTLETNNNDDIIYGSSILLSGSPAAGRGHFEMHHTLNRVPPTTPHLALGKLVRLLRYL